MYYDRSKYVKVVNKDGVSVTTTTMTKQLHYMPITPSIRKENVIAKTIILCRILRMPRLCRLLTVLI
jgi:hypothetical protein